ncbi:MarR family transcriptional regulator [Aurantiacibacter xanthus]|uniref:MarR family transcriptional regulator n=1 Tax=Aurantiacibacter xanthus TaxID=1784712 RepID=A0A3A1P3R6_9SPHN|nr:MarR family transcriptional regulator [Aurantiacibacter xanthus]RIV82935.1 MarR family transcriptional regulator [Aurantiacibacter xanthus]
MTQVTAPSVGISESAELSSTEDHRDESGRFAIMRELTSMRMIKLYSLLRRSGMLARRRQFGMNETDWWILAQVGEFAPLSLNGLAERLGQDRGQLSRAVKSLVQRGLLRRDRKPGGPEIEIALAPEGQRIYRDMIELVIERDRELTEGFAPESIEVLRGLVEEMIVRAEAMLAEEKRLAALDAERADG